MSTAVKATTIVLAALLATAPMPASTAKPGGVLCIAYLDGEKADHSVRIAPLDDDPLEGTFVVWTGGRRMGTGTAAGNVGGNPRSHTRWRLEGVLVVE